MWPSLLACAPLVCIGPVVAERGLQVTWNWCYRQLGVTCESWIPWKDNAGLLAISAIPACAVYCDKSSCLLRLDMLSALELLHAKLDPEWRLKSGPLPSLRCSIPDDTPLFLHLWDVLRKCHFKSTTVRHSV